MTPERKMLEAAARECQCRRCLRDRDERSDWGLPAEMSRMILCAQCGNKRCPHAADHRNACTGSNEPGQPGSAYPAAAAIGERMQGG